MANIAFVILIILYIAIPEQVCFEETDPYDNLVEKNCYRFLRYVFIEKGRIEKEILKNSLEKRWNNLDTNQYQIDISVLFPNSSSNSSDSS